MVFAERIFARACVECPSDPPAPKQCPAGQISSLSVQTCQRCPEARCVSNGEQTSNHAGAIAGGVVGGLVGLGFIIGGLLWYKYRHRRRRHLQRLEEESAMSPPDSPEYGGDRELKAPSITTTHGDSQILPFEIHFNESPFGNPYNHNGTPTIRESIRESEYSFGSENPDSDNNGGLRHYDVAVQGRANLVNLDRARRQRPQPPPSRLAQGQLYDIVEHSESAMLTGPRTSSHAATGPPTRQPSRAQTRPGSMHSSATRPASTRPQSLLPASGQSADAHAFVTNGAERQSRTRFSRASSREYVADLPDEARLYESHGLFEN